MSPRFQQAAETWWAWTAAMSVQVTVLVVMVAVLDRVLRPWAWPQLRAALWALVLVKLRIKLLGSRYTTATASATPAAAAAAAATSTAAPAASATPAAAAAVRPNVLTRQIQTNKHQTKLTTDV